MALGCQALILPVEVVCACHHVSRVTEVIHNAFGWDSVPLIVHIWGKFMHTGYSN